ncbi:MAG: FAD-binding protein [Sporolactobacillus sp.]
MYDCAVIGEGLSGLLTAIWLREEGRTVALAASGTGKIVQSSGLFDLIPGSDAGMERWMQLHQLDDAAPGHLEAAVDRFKATAKAAACPYAGDALHAATVISGSGRLKKTGLYPVSVLPVSGAEKITVVGFDGLTDFQPAFVAANLGRDLPHADVKHMSIDLGLQTQRTLTQLDIARQLDDDEALRQRIMTVLSEKPTSAGADLLVFPSALGVHSWRDLMTGIGTPMTEAAGLPPNAAAFRLYRGLRQLAVRLGVRFYLDATVFAADDEGGRVTSVRYRSGGREQALAADNFVLATGGVLGGGLEMLAGACRETALGLTVDGFGRPLETPANVWTTGAACGLQETIYGITGGMYNLLSVYRTVGAVMRMKEGSVSHA